MQGTATRATNKDRLLNSIAYREQRCARKEGKKGFCLFFCLFVWVLLCSADGERERLDFAVLSFQGG